MKYLLTLAAFLSLSGCKAAGSFTVVGTAGLEKDLPDGTHAVSKVEVRYAPAEEKPKGN